MSYYLESQGEVTLGTATFSVSVQKFDDEGVEDMVFLTGSRGAQYMLRPYSNRENLYQVISLKSGAPLTQHGNQVRVKYDEAGKLVKA